MTGKDLVEFIKTHNLEDAEWDDCFVVVLADGSWLQYDPEETFVRHYPDPDGDWAEGVDVISFEEAMKLREEIGYEQT